MFKELQLGPKQRTTVAAALTVLSVLVLVIFFYAAVVGLARFVNTFQNVLLPPVVACILAMLLRPYYNWLLKLCRGTQAAALVLFFLSGIIPLGVFIGFAGVFVVNQLIQLFEELPATINSMVERGQQHWPQVAALLDKYGLTSEFGGLLENPGQMAVKTLQTVGKRMSQSAVQTFQSVAGLFTWAVLPVYLAFFLMAKPFRPRQLAEFLPFLKPKTKNDVIYLLEQFVDILLTFFRGQIIIALAQGVLYAVGFVIVGLPYGLIIGMGLGLLNIIPYLGSIAGLCVAIPLAYFGVEGSILRVVLVLVVFCVVQAIEGNILTPRIMGNRTGLHPALIIFAVFFWGVALGGILGMMLAIPLTAFAVVFWRLLKKNYITEVA
ncbi:MAG: AI-2E family transporter [Anaerohalosphaeraceae bacterium]